MLKNILQKGLKKVASMRRGDSFSDLSTYNAGYLLLAGEYSDFVGDVIDLQSDKFKFRDLLRFDTYISSLSNMTGGGFLHLYLRHSDDYGGVYTGVSKADVIGPKEVETFGNFKAFFTYDSEQITDMGDKIYGIVYIGQKRYVRIYAFKYDPIVSQPIFLWCTVAGLNAYAKKYNRYSIYGAAGGQVK
jgi:hypothetical protein